MQKILCGLLLFSGISWGGVNTNDLAPLPEIYRKPPQSDWLISNKDFKAGVFKTGRPNELVLSNGLISRTFRLAPNGATVGLDNRVSGEAVLRGVKPEARVSINGIAFDVGGLKGQPNYAYLKPEWLDGLTADPEAFTLTGFAVEEPKARLAWKRVRHAAPDAVWPPEGITLRMDYRLPALSLEKLLGVPQSSDRGRRSLFETDFSALSDGWRIHTSKGLPRSAFSNEGKTGEIYTPANTSVFAERKLPAGTRLVECGIHWGTDRSASWGPGLALVWPDRTVKFNLRPGGSADSEKPQFGVFDGRREVPDIRPDIALDPARPVHMRLRIAGTKVFCEARLPDGPWKTCHAIKSEAPWQDPALLRIGKLDRSGGGSDFSEPGDWVRLKVRHCRVYGALDKDAMEEEAGQVARLKKLRVSVHYTLYDGVPLYSKWLTVTNPTESTITLDTFTSEILAAVEYASYVEDRGIPFPRPNIHVETDYAFCGMTHHNSSHFSVHWVRDPDYHSQVNYRKNTPCLLEVRPTVGPDQDIGPGKTFTSFRAFIMPFDATDRERKGLSLRRLYRTAAPWVLENPLMMHVRFANWPSVKLAIDQCAEVGFEMVILTFGSGFNIENDSPEYMQKMKQYADYARSKGIEIGGYSLLASRRIRPESDNAVNPETGTIHGQTFGTAPALASKWGQDYFRKLYQFYGKSGFTLLEHDGSYPGDLDAAARPPLQKGVKDSRWVQWRIITDFYRHCRANGIYLNVPDFYYLSGSSKSGMGYREVNWSLPRAQQVLHTRQNIYDGTWLKTPSMGWMFVPLTQYHGGGAAATIEPLDEHLDHYERMLSSNLAMGVQACYRGPRLYDTDRTKRLVKKWVAWFKKHRAILESDMVHGRRPDGRDLDWMLHVNPGLPEKGMLVVFNPLDRPVEKDLSVDLYYTGLTDAAAIREREGAPKTMPLDRRCRADVPVRVDARGMTWFVISAASDGPSR